jgi:hypothetical protein
VAETGEGGMGKRELAGGMLQHGQTSLPMPPRLGCTANGLSTPNAAVKRVLDGYNHGRGNGALEMAQYNELERIRLHLGRRETPFWLKVCVMILVGVPLSFLAPLVLGTVLWMAALYGTGLFIGVSLHGWWWWFFWPLAIIMIPLFYFWEFRAGGDYLGAVPSRESSQRLSDTPVPGPAQAVGAASDETVSVRSPLAAFFGLFLSGPRMVVSALRQMRVARRLNADRLRAAAVVHLLNVQESGVEPSRLLREGEKVQDILPELAYLSFYQWIGIGKKWAKVWLYSAAREALKR